MERFKIQKERRVFRGGRSSIGCACKLSEEESGEVESGLARARERMGELFTPDQILGRSTTIGCVALEIT